LWLCLALLQESRVNTEIMAFKDFETSSRVFARLRWHELYRVRARADHEFAAQVQQVVRQGAIISAKLCKA